MKEINPDETSRAEAFRLWMNAPMPMVTLFKTLDVTNLARTSKRKGLKFNMLMCWCIGKAAIGIKEFYMLPVDDKLIRYNSIAVNTIVANREGEVSSCDIPFSNDLGQFNEDYLRLTKQVAECCRNIDGAVGMYSGIFNNPFIICGRYRRHLWKRTLTVSFQFHHTQMDGAHAAKFLDMLQKEINGNFRIQY